MHSFCWRPRQRSLSLNRFRSPCDRKRSTPEGRRLRLLHTLWRRLPCSARPSGPSPSSEYQLWRATDVGEYASRSPLVGEIASKRRDPSQPIGLSQGDRRTTISRLHRFGRRSDCRRLPNVSKGPRHIQGWCFMNAFASHRGTRLWGRRARKREWSVTFSRTFDFWVGDG